MSYHKARDDAPDEREQAEILRAVRLRLQEMGDLSKLPNPHHYDRIELVMRAFFEPFPKDLRDQIEPYLRGWLLEEKAKKHGGWRA